MSMIINPYWFGAGGGALAPDDIADLLFWYEADAIVGLSDNDPVSTWEDLGPHGLDLTQSGSARPTFQENILNSLPAVQFDGTDDFMSTVSNVHKHDGSEELTHTFLVARYDAASFADFDGLITLNGPVSIDSYIILVGDSGTTKFFNGGLDENYKKNGTSFADNDMQAPMNTFAVVEIEQNISGVSPAGLMVGKDRDFTGGRFGTWHICAMVGYSTTGGISSSNAAGLRQHFYNKYALSGT